MSQSMNRLMTMNQRPFMVAYAAVCGVCAVLLLGYNGDERLHGNSHTQLPHTQLIVTTTAMIGDPIRRIGGKRMEVVTLMREGVDPHLYRPTRSDMALLAAADMIIWTGPSLEAPLKRPIGRLQQHGKKVVTMLELVPERSLHLSDEGHIDPHLWMDPLIWSHAIGEAVDRIADNDLDNAAFYLARLQVFQKATARLHESIARSVQNLSDQARVLLTAHDAFFYFGRRYNFDVRGIQGMSTESEAGLHDINRLVELSVSNNIPALFAESSVNPRYVQALIEGSKARGHDITMGGILYADSMGAPGTRAGTYLGMIAHNVRTILRAIQPHNAQIAQKQNNAAPQKQTQQTTIAATPEVPTQP